MPRTYKAKPGETVGTYFKRRLKAVMKQEHHKRDPSNPRDYDFDTLKVNTVCGRACKQVIDATAELIYQFGNSGEDKKRDMYLQQQCEFACEVILYG